MFLHYDCGLPLNHLFGENNAYNTWARFLLSFLILKTMLRYQSKSSFSMNLVLKSGQGLYHYFINTFNGTLYQFLLMNTIMEELHLLINLVKNRLNKV